MIISLPENITLNTEPPHGKHNFRHTLCLKPPAACFFFFFEALIIANTEFQLSVRRDWKVKRIMKSQKKQRLNDADSLFTVVFTECAIIPQEK